MDEATIDKLEFSRVRDALGARCATSLGKRRARSMRPAVKAKLVKDWLTQVRELTDLVAADSAPPMGGVHDIREAVRATALPAPLEPEALGRIADTLVASGNLHAWFDRIADRVPSLASLKEQIHDLSEVAAVINEKIDGRGGVRDHASERLAAVRRGIEEARGRARDVVDSLLRQDRFSRFLQYAGSTFHNDRLVLPLKAEHRGRIPGIIHRSSDSGATLFVEPAESVALNNTLVGLRERESKEITRILTELSRHVQAHADVILTMLRAVGVLDLITAKCRYGLDRTCVCPEIDDHGVLDLHQARHPVLIELFDRDGHTGAAEPGTDKREGREASGVKTRDARDPGAREGEAPAEPRSDVKTRDAGATDAQEPQPPGESPQVVPIDVRLGDDFDVLVITGPNTGGKTVSLKTVGLMALMTQCGMPIPANAGSRMPLYRDIVMDIGDEQSLQQSLSTFSSHLQTQLNILKRCGPTTLVLIDELGAGTDPDEGAAIGRALLNELLRRKSKTMVTTHLSALKAVAYTTPRVDNASVEFDAATLKPSYRLRLGEPGNSNALIIARRLGMAGALIKQARSFLDKRATALNRAITGTLRSRRAAERARNAARKATLDAHIQRCRLEEQTEALAREKEAYQRWVDWITGLQAGDPVFFKSLQRPGTVVRMELHRQKALVSAGGMDIEVPLVDLEPPSSDA